MIKQDHTFKKQFGQNFIKNQNTIFDVLSLLDLNTNDEVIEIGPGDGRFTEIIANTVKKLTLIEIDFELINFLNEKFENYANIEIINQDILNLKLDELENYKVFGALPYNISKKIIQKFLETNNKPTKIVFIIQKEVAQDYTKKTPKSSFLSNYAKIYANLNYKKTIDKDQFHPKPKVDGGVILIEPYDKPRVEDPKEFTKFLKNGFRSPRKKLMKNLKSIYKETDWDRIWQELKFGENLRPAEVEFEDWIKLYETFSTI